MIELMLHRQTFRGPAHDSPCRLAKGNAPARCFTGYCDHCTVPLATRFEIDSTLIIGSEHSFDLSGKEPGMWVVLDLCPDSDDVSLVVTAKCGLQFGEIVGADFVVRRFR